MSRDQVRDFFASRGSMCGVDWADRESLSGNPSAARVTTEPKIIVHPPVYGGAIEEQVLAIGKE